MIVPTEKIFIVGLKEIILIIKYFIITAKMPCEYLIKKLFWIINRQT